MTECDIADCRFQISDFRLIRLAFVVILKSRYRYDLAAWITTNELRVSFRSFLPEWC